MKFDKSALISKISAFISKSEKEIVNLKNKQASLKKDREECLKKNIEIATKRRNYLINKIDSGSIKIQTESRWNKEVYLKIHHQIPASLVEIPLPEDKKKQIDEFKKEIEKAKQDIAVLNMAIGDRVDVPNSFNFKKYLY